MLASLGATVLLVGCDSQPPDADSAERSACAVALEAQEAGARAVCEAEFAEADSAESETESSIEVVVARALAKAEEIESLRRFADLLSASESEPAVLEIQGYRHLDSGQLGEAVATFRKALGAQHATQEDEVALQYGLLSTYWQQADYAAALKAGSEGLLTARQIQDDTWASYHLQGLFSVLLDMGDLRGARAALEEASRLSSGDSPSDTFYLDMNRAIVLRNQGLAHLARDTLLKAQERIPEIPNLDRGSLRSFHLNVVSTALDLGELDLARKHLELAWQQKNPDGSLFEALHYFKARWANAAGEPEQARLLSQQALEMGATGDWVPRLAKEQGKALRALGEEAGAVAAFERAIAGVEALQEQVGFDRLKPWIAERNRDPYEDLFDLHFDRGDFRSALGALDRAKTQTFINALADADDSGQTPAEIDAWVAHSVDSCGSDGVPHQVVGRPFDPAEC